MSIRSSRLRYAVLLALMILVHLFGMASVTMAATPTPTSRPILVPTSTPAPTATVPPMITERLGFIDGKACLGVTAEQVINGFKKAFPKQAPAAWLRKEFVQLDTGYILPESVHSFHLAEFGPEGDRHNGAEKCHEHIGTPPYYGIGLKLTIVSEDNVDMYSVMLLRGKENLEVPAIYQWNPGWWIQ